MNGINDGTLVRTEESFDGLIPRLFRGRLRTKLNGTLERELEHLKTEAECAVVAA